MIILGLVNFHLLLYQLVLSLLKYILLMQYCVSKFFLEILVIQELFDSGRQKLILQYCVNVRPLLGVLSDQLVYQPPQLVGER